MSNRKSIEKPKRSLFRRINEWLHLWLGLASGIVVFVVCLTAALWVFRYEVWYFTEPYQRVKAQNQPFLPPSVLIAKASAFAHRQEGKPVEFTSITYGTSEKSAFTNYTPEKGKFYSVYLNPYDGRVLYHKTGPSAAESFFIFVRSGHRFFFLPQTIGSPVVGASCIIFVITLITGLIWWYPKKWTKSTRDKSFKIKWNGNWKRVNLDLHNVLGFYAFIVALALTISGIVYSFEWFDKGYQWLLTGKTTAPHGHSDDYPHSDTTFTRPLYDLPADILWQRIRSDHSGGLGRLNINFPKEASDPYEITINPQDGTIYKTFTRFFDRNTLAELPSEESKKFEEMSAGEKLYAMNFDIHVGQIYGLPTRILAFFASLIGASLPVTGFIIWWFRGKNTKAGKKQKPTESPISVN
ncbi:putative iron-regulated membrane protein [Dyadobacter sp. BE34]|uniref:Iron-regulated membrane protein n=1 Tax=Dyadobacter fermentans TaxID=94254 RepID=A0ABU1R4T0_9BACT|nr:MULTISPECIES: PepSY-associated TM helix domain-containing protein [Dyadobacter]MDR6808414.1 putative iron-regulated membrane protein [Dyadobacter fermentans]MDR7045769.1 putative iron-regulated membrane protein [Dyadobacter sp. BE242]MDR7200082.1 putative iron-regulated membrane protein [Dyadobacter sp. BE34]MDR7218042.1 putative iron-regulated membrane protein [Dyadobacter sp. BE31]MDR7265973.1 putative iron-regulated membrane protein [Dyadobacter sp. BE32]